VSVLSPDLRDDVDDGCALAQDDRVVAVVPGGAIGLVRLRQDRRVGGRLRQYEDVASSNPTRKMYGVSGGRAAIEEHLDVVATRTQIQWRASAVVNLDGFVVGRTFDVF